MNTFANKPSSRQYETIPFFSSYSGQDITILLKFEGSSASESDNFSQTKWLIIQYQHLTKVSYG